MNSGINVKTMQSMSSDSHPRLMPKSGALNGVSVWRDQIALSMLIDLKPF
ncbi:MAG: hypothetical protein WAO76_10965 [Georgfuchsia sp.]